MRRKIDQKNLKSEEFTVTAADFPYAYENKRYHTLSYENKKRGYKLYKAVVDAGFTCPNIDGSRGRGGCIFCSGGSGYFTAPPEISVQNQINAELARLRRKDKSARAIAYFQAHTNTYASPTQLQFLYEQALACEGIAGLSIATRPDTLPDAVLDLLSELARRTALTVELGLQTIHEATAVRINRCYPLGVFEHAFHALKGRGIRVCVHLINGLPGETPEMMLQSAAYLGQLKPDAVKLQMLHIIRGTAMEPLFTSGQYRPMSLEEYVQLVCCQLELLPPEIVIERLTGDGDKKTLLAPLWTTDKLRVLGSIDQTLARWNSWQGRCVSAPEARIRDFCRAVRCAGDA